MLQRIEQNMETTSSNWWLFILRGVMAILFGILVVAWPIEGVLALVILFGAYALVDGILFLIFGFTHKGNWGKRAWPIISGVVGIGAGVVAFSWPGITAVALLVVIAFWALVTGIAQVMFAFVIPNDVGNRVLLALSGVFSLIFGIFLLARPTLGALAVVWMMGAFAVLAGVYLIAFGISLKALRNRASAKQITAK